MSKKHPRDQFISIFGRKPAIEALNNYDLSIDKILIAKNGKGSIVDEIIKSASKRKIKVVRESIDKINRISRHPKQDQGVVLDVLAANMDSLDNYLESLTLNGKASLNLIALDGITTPANVGMIIRTLLAADFDGLVIPKVGCPEIGPLVIKASAGTALKAKILRCEKIEDGLKKLKEAGFKLFGLSGNCKKNIYESTYVGNSVFVMGNESNGISSITEKLIDNWITVPMYNGIESLNVACASSILCYEVMRKKHHS